MLQIQPAHDFGEETLGGQLDNMIFDHLESGGHVEDVTTLGSFGQNLIKVEKTK